MPARIDNGVRDKAVRNSLQSIIDTLEYEVTGDAAANTIIMDRAPTSSDVGDDGQFFFDTSTNNLYVFTENQWDLAGSGLPGADAIQVVVTIRTTEDTSTDPATWDLEDEGQFFRNNRGDTKYLLATVLIGGVEQDQTAHQGCLLYTSPSPRDS